MCGPFPKRRYYQVREICMSSSASEIESNETDENDEIELDDFGSESSTSIRDLLKINNSHLSDCAYSLNMFMTLITFRWVRIFFIFVSLGSNSSALKSAISHR